MRDMPASCFGFRITMMLRKQKRKEMGMEAAAPRPGVPVPGSESGRPVMAVLDLLGRRWTMRILWEGAKRRQASANCSDDASACPPAC
ncbi:hypothetical protein ACIGDI_27590 [Streptomyces sp. NPDC085900]|uniref:hypothetical protein n=1 Tax=Streptomyces sp. NPDC085900 TaxID=3365737 RepID=UPI0037CF4EEB